MTQFLPYLRRHGIEVVLEPLLDNRYVKSISTGETVGRRKEYLAAYLRRLWRFDGRPDLDILWVHSELFPNLPGFFERVAGWAGKPIICDFDDAIFHKYDGRGRGLAQRLLKGKLETLLRRSSGCSCGNEYIKAYVERFCPNCVIIPTVVDTSEYVPGPPRPAAGTLAVGWIGTPTTWLCKSLLPVITPWLKANGAVLDVVGAGPRALGIDGVIGRDWEEAREIKDVQAMDIGIMPLPNDDWARGKMRLQAHPIYGLRRAGDRLSRGGECPDRRRRSERLSGPGPWRLATGAGSFLAQDPALRRAMGKRGAPRWSRNIISRRRSRSCST